MNPNPCVMHPCVFLTVCENGTPRHTREFKKMSRSQQTSNLDSPAAGTSQPVSPSYSGQLYSYLYNGVASLSQAVSGEVRLLDNTPCHILGRTYVGPKTTQWTSESIRCLPYFTYRRSLTVPLRNGSDHDAGWGCMIRTGQMMVCQTLRRLFRCEQTVTVDPMQFAMVRTSSNTSSPPVSPRPPSQATPGRSPQEVPVAGNGGGLTSSTAASQPYSNVFLWVQDFFRDTPDAAYGLHRMTEEGASLNVSVGSWFSPTVLARSVVALSAKCAQVHERLHVIAALDQTVSVDAMLETIVVEEKAVLVLIPLMLGLSSIGKSYEKVFLRMLELQACVGLVGGKPSKSLYFVGHQGDNVFYLDPHVVQPAFLSRSTLGNVSGPRGTTTVQSLDPNVLACFFFEREEQLLEWCDELAEINRLGEFPVVTVRSSVTGPPSTSVMRSASPRDFSVDPCDFDEDLL